MSKQLKFGKGIKYVVIGASVVNIFLQLMNFVMLFYSTVITQTPVLYGVFSQLWIFALVGGLVWAVALFVVGYLWRNRSQFFLADREVDVRTDKYQTERFVPVMIPIWKVFVEMAKKQNMNPEEIANIERCITNSEAHA